MQVLILCGGLGTRLREETEFKPKPMIEVGGRPLLWHIMSGYARHGYKDFVLLLGYKGDHIRRYFLDYHLFGRDFTVDLSGPGRIEVHADPNVLDWRVTLVETGAATMTGGRIARAARYLKGDRFMVTYGDGVTDADIGALVRFHEEHGALGTVTGVRPPSRFGTLTTEGDHVRRFSEKPVSDGWINGGFFVFERKFLDYLTTDESCILEKDPLERLSLDGQLRVYRHGGFWHCVDTLRDLQLLQEMWNSGRPPWM